MSAAFVRGQALLIRLSLTSVRTTSDAMDSTEDSRSSHTVLTPNKAMQDLHFIAGALRGDADAVAFGQHPNGRLVQLAGWTIYLAGRSGLLRSVLALDQVVDSFFLETLDGGVPQLLDDGVPGRAGPPIVPDSIRTIEQFLQEIENRVAKDSPDRTTAERPKSPPLHLPLDPGEAACSLVMCAWRYLAARFRHELPDEMKRLYLSGHPLSDLRPEDSQGLKKAAWVCDFLATQIGRAFGIHDRKEGPNSQDESGNVLGDIGYLLHADIRKLCSNDEQFQRVRKNLENWRKKYEDRCKATNSDPGSQRQDWAYPASKVKELIEKDNRRRRPE
jgi:hypothetical protein